MAGAQEHLTKDRAQAHGRAADRSPVVIDDEALAEARQELDRFEALRLIGRLTPSQDVRYHELLARRSQLLRDLGEDPWERG